MKANMKNFAVVTISASGGVGIYRLPDRTLPFSVMRALVHGSCESVIPSQLFGLDEDFRLLINEDADELAPVNVVASAIYGRDFLQGDVVLCSGSSPDPAAEPDLYPFEIEKALLLCDHLRRLSDRLVMNE